VDARNNLGVSYARVGKKDEAELEFRKALLVSADSAGAHFGLATLDLERGNKAAAAQELREVIRVQPHYPQAESLLALALQ
jgi:Flp pilus assembly protein TadD